MDSYDKTVREMLHADFARFDQLDAQLAEMNAHIERARLVGIRQTVNHVRNVATRLVRTNSRPEQWRDSSYRDESATATLDPLPAACNAAFHPTTRDQTVDFLKDLFGESTVVRERLIDTAIENDLEHSVIAVYTDAVGRIRHLLVANLALTNSAGTAFSLIPPQCARDSVQARIVPDPVRRNFHRIANACTALFEERSSLGIALDDVLYPPTMISDEVRQLVIDSAETRMVFNVGISGYDSGCLTLI